LIKYIKLFFWFIAVRFNYPLPKLKAFLFKISGHKIGKNVKIREFSFLPNPLINKVTIGDNTIIGYSCFIEGKGKLTIGSDCFIGPLTFLNLYSNIEISNNVSIGTSSIILTHDAVISASKREHKTRMDKEGKIIIKDNVSIGSNVIIMPKVTLEHHCVIGAFSLVNKDCNKRSLYFGIPAKLIKKIV